MEILHVMFTREKLSSSIPRAVVIIVIAYFRIISEKCRCQVAN